MPQSGDGFMDVEGVIARLRAQARPPTPRFVPDSGAVRLSRCDARGVPGHYQIREAIGKEPRDTKALVAVRDTITEYMAVRGAPNAMGSLPVLLTLCGPTRTGKTVALSYAVSSVEASALYVTTYQMADVPRVAKFSDDHPWNRWRQVDVLAIDELHADESAISRVKSLLYERWDNGKCTLLAGNLTVQVLMERYLCDPALKRRVEEEYGSEGRLKHLPFAVVVKDL